MNARKPKLNLGAGNCISVILAIMTMLPAASRKAGMTRSVIFNLLSLCPPFPGFGIQIGVSVISTVRLASR